MMNDIVENMEDAATRWAEDNIKDDQFLCPTCKRWCNLNEAKPSFSSPYAIPICKDC